MPCLSTVMPWEAWYFGRGAKPGQPSPFKWTYHFGFGVRASSTRPMSRNGTCIPTNKKVGVLYPNDADGNAIRDQSGAAAGQGGLHHHRSRPLRGRHDRLFRADREVQGGEVRDLQHLPDSARFRRVLAAGGAAGLHQDGQDRPDRQDRALSRRRRGARRSRLQSCQRRLLAQGVPLQVVADRRRRRGARRRLREGVGQAMDAAARRDAVAVRCRLRGAEGERRSDGQGGGREGAVDAARRRRSAARSISPGARCRTSRPGPIIGTQWVKAPAGVEVQARLCRDRATRPTRTCRSAPSCMPFNG